MTHDMPEAAQATAQATAPAATPTDPAPVTIALLWHSMNSDNLGVGALTLANIALLRRACALAGRSPRFLVVGWRDTRPWYGAWDDVENVPIRLRHLVSPRGPVAEAIRSADIVFDIGGGDSFTDIYGPKRFLTVWGAKVRALAAGKPLILSPQTVGPFETALARRLAVTAMNRCRFVTTRDAPSTRFLAEIGVRAPVIETTDVAMGLPHDPPAPRGDGGPVRVGVNVSGLLWNGGYTQANQFGLKADYPALIREILAFFAAEAGVELHLVGHVQSETQPVEDDQRVGEALAAEYGAIAAPVFRSPTEAKSYIAGLDFFTGARMHATIAAFSAGVPVVPMAYSRKFAGVFGTLGYDRVADCKSEDAAEILTRIREGYFARETLKAEIAEAMRGVERRLDLYVERAADVLSRA